MASEKQVKMALDRYEKELSQKRNVIGMGVRDAANKSGAEMTIYVSKKVPKEELAENEIIPEKVELQIEGENVEVPISVIDMGSKFSTE